MADVTRRVLPLSSKWALARSAIVQSVGLVGAAIFIEGIREIYQPAALIAGGALIVGWTILKVRSET